MGLSHQVRRAIVDQLVRLIGPEEKRVSRFNGRGPLLVPDQPAPDMTW